MQTSRRFELRPFVRNQQYYTLFTGQSNGRQHACVMRCARGHKLREEVIRFVVLKSHITRSCSCHLFSLIYILKPAANSGKTYTLFRYGQFR